MKNYIEPKTEELARLAAEAMGWTERPFDLEWYWDKLDIAIYEVNEFHPENCHDHAQILVEEAFKRGINASYSFHLLEIIDTHILARTYLANPEQKTRAFLRSIHESKK